MLAGAAAQEGGTEQRPALEIERAVGFLACQALDLGVAWTQGPEFGPDLVPVLSSAASLGAFFPAVQAPWPAALLDRMTVFGGWGLALWIVGLRETFGLGWRRAAVVAAPVWVLLLVLAAALDVLGRSMAVGALG